MSDNQQNSDQLQRFIFDNSDIRGEIISLEQSYQQIIQNRNYPPVIANLLGEMLAAIGLMSATLKFDGVITLQARGDGPLSMIMVDCTRHHALRGLAQFDDGSDYPDSASLRGLIGSGHLAVTIDPVNGERYQGIVPLEHDSLAQCLEDYFQRSEQLPTRFWLNCNEHRCAGLLLQALPRQIEKDPAENQQIWEHVLQLADTLTQEEQLSLDQNTLLFRLFHQDELRLLGEKSLHFQCSCSRDRTLNTLITLGEEELLSIIEEQGQIAIECHFCLHAYTFSDEEIRNLFSEPPPVLH